MQIRTVSFSFSLMIAVLCSCKSEDDLLPACGSDTLRYIISNGSKMRISFDNKGRVTSFQPVSSSTPFLFKDITLSEKAFVTYNSNGTVSKIELESGETYMTYEYSSDGAVYKNMLLGEFSGRYTYYFDNVGKKISQYKFLTVNGGLPPPRQSYLMRTSNYNQNSDVEKSDEFVLDLNYPGDRLWNTYTYKYDQTSNPLLNTLKLLTVQEDALFYSAHNCINQEVIFSLRGNTSLGKTTNTLKYDTKNRLLSLKTTDGKYILEFSYCD